MDDKPQEVIDRMIKQPGMKFQLFCENPSCEWREKWWSYENDKFECMTRSDFPVFKTEEYQNINDVLQQLDSDIKEAVSKIRQRPPAQEGS